MTEPVSPCSKGRSFLLKDSRHVTVVVQALRPVPGWSTFRCPLKKTQQECASIFVSASWSATACMPFCTFSSSSYFKIERRCSRVIQFKCKVHKVPNCVCFTKLLQSLSYLHKACSRLLNINCRHSFQSCMSDSLHPLVICCYDDECLSRVVLPVWLLPKVEVFLLKLCLNFKS